MADKKRIISRLKKTAPELPSAKTALQKAQEFVSPRSALPDAVRSRTRLTSTPKPSSQEKNTEDTKFDDAETDKAIDEIIASEADEVLAVQDASTPRTRRLVPPKPGFKQKLRRLIKNKWTWISTAIIFLLLLALPLTRYPILGLFMTKQITLEVADSLTSQPVTKANVIVGGENVLTDSQGQAKLKVRLGNSSVKVNKQYYSATNQKIFVGFSSKGPVIIKLVATGRRVPVKVINTITGNPVANVDIQVNDTSAKTDSNGLASMVLSTKDNSYQAVLTLSGYNTIKTKVVIADKLISSNVLKITPAGKIYYLSKDDGRIDVVKSNLDGTSRTVVLGGTGSEDQVTTSLLATSDWKYLVLEAKRDSSQQALYVIDTSTDKVTQFDSGNANFNLVGWSGHNFVYDQTQNSTLLWQSGKEALKSYNADSGTLNKLDQNQVEGTDTAYAYQKFSNFYVLEGQVVYVTQWVSGPSGATYDLSTKNDTVRSVQVASQIKKDYQNWPSATTVNISSTLGQPQLIYYSVNDGSQTTYYQYQNQAVSPANISQDTFSLQAHNYYLSQAGLKTLWLNNSALYIGDKDAQHGTQVKGLAGYDAYGWYSDDYILVTSGGNIYIVPSSGVATGSYPLKVANFFKTTAPYTGYGYGYGWQS